MLKKRKGKTMGKIKAQLDDMPIDHGDEGISEWKMKKDMNAAYKIGQDKLRKEARVVKKILVEIEYYSECCDAPPIDYDAVDVCDENTGYCMECRMGTPFYIKGKRKSPSMDNIFDLLDRATEIQKELEDK